MDFERPRPALQAARLALGWSQAVAARELAALARARGGPGAAPASLKTLLSRWENGHAVPDEQYRALLGELYGRTSDELGLHVPPGRERAGAPDPRGAHRLRARLAAAAAVGDELLELWRQQLSVARRLDDEVGAAGAGSLVLAQVDELDRTLLHATTSARRAAVAAVLADAAALAGWQALDQGDPEQAWRHLDRSGTAALEAQASAAVARAAAGQATVLVEIGEPHAALALLDRSEPGPPAARAWRDAARGAASAATGAAAASRRAFDRAEQALAAPSPGPDRDPTGSGPRGATDLAAPPGGVVIELTDLHRWRGHALVTLEDPDAVGPLEQALAAGVRAARDRAMLHADLSVALAAAKRHGPAAEHARTARRLAERIGSVRTVAILDGRGGRPDDPAPGPPSRTAAQRPPSRAARS